MNVHYDLDTMLWMDANKSTEISWTEEQIWEAYKSDPYSLITQWWCQIMLAGLLGSVDKAKEKYPEMYI